MRVQRRLKFKKKDLKNGYLVKNIISIGTVKFVKLDNLSYK